MKKKKKIRFRKPMKADPTLVFSYKEPEVLRRYVTRQGSLLPRVETSLTQKQQRRLAREVKRARHLALLPFTQLV